MFNKKLVLGIMLLSLIVNNNTKGTQLGTPVNNAEFSNPKSNKNVFEDLEKDLHDFIKTLEKESFYQIRNIDDNKFKEIYEKIWQEYDSYFENELSWVFDTFSDPPDEITKAMVDQLSEKIAMFKNKVLNFKFKIEEIQAEKSRKMLLNVYFYVLKMMKK